MRGSAAGKIGLLLLLLGAVAVFFLFDLGQYLTLANLKARQEELAALVAQRPLLMVGGFFLVYVAVTGLSLPGAAIMTLAAGAIFGLWQGVLIVSFASAIGASLAFLSSRYLLRDWVSSRFGRRVKAIDRGVEKDGTFYLLTLRLIPAFPFFLINLSMGLTAMRLPVFYIVSQIGMLPGTIVYVNAGTQLATIERTGDILSPALIGSFVLLGIFPLIAKFVIGRVKRGRIYKGYKRPRRFDRNLIVIGAGAGGLVSAYIAATVRAKVTLIEAHRMGGDCLNTGCVPSKSLIRSARLVHEMRTADRFGLGAQEPVFSFAAIMARVREVIRVIEPADSVQRYTKLGVDVRIGHARIVDPWTVEIGGERLTARSILVAAGAEPLVPPISGLGQSGYVTSDTMWDALAQREAPPGRLVIIGGGPIGVEMAQAFRRLGSKVTIVQSGEHILAREDEEVAEFIAAQLRSEGVEILTGHKAERCEGKTLVVSGAGGERSLPFEDLLVAVGRKPRLSGYGLEELGIDVSGKLERDEYLQLRYPNMYAVGDVASPYQLTHAAAHEAWFAAVNALFGSVKRFRAEYATLPWTTFTDPEVAHVGHNEASARAEGLEYEVVRYSLSHLDRAVTEGANEGFVKLLVQPGKDRILGATIVAAQAGEMLAEYVLAMKHRIGLNKILGTVHAYPTMSEANKYAAGEWKKARQPERMLAWAERWHGWRRG